MALAQEVLLAISLYCGKKVSFCISAKSSSAKNIIENIKTGEKIFSIDDRIIRPPSENPIRSAVLSDILM